MKMAHRNTQRAQVEWPAVANEAVHECVATIIEAITQMFVESDCPPLIAVISLRGWLLATENPGITEDQFAAKIAEWYLEQKARIH